MTTWLWLLWEHLFGTPIPRPQPIEQRMREEFRVIQISLRRRRKEGNQNIGRAAEQNILHRTLSELEYEWKRNPNPVPMPHWRVGR